MDAALAQAQAVLEELAGYSSPPPATPAPSTDAERMAQLEQYERGVVALVERMSDAGGELGRAMAAGSAADIARGADVALQLDTTLDFRSAIRNDLTLFKRLQQQLRTALGARATEVQDRVQALSMFLNPPERNRGIFVRAVAQSLSSTAQPAVLEALGQTFRRHSATRAGDAWAQDREAQAAFRSCVFLLALLADEGEFDLRAKVQRAGVNWRRVCAAVHDLDTVPCGADMVMAPRFKLGEAVPEPQGVRCVLS